MFCLPLPAACVLFPVPGNIASSLVYVDTSLSGAAEREAPQQRPKEVGAKGRVAWQRPENGHRPTPESRRQVADGKYN